MNREIEGIYILWKRELLRFYRSKSRIIGSLGMPFFFLAILGTGLNNVFPMAGGGNYMQFIAPGIIGMVLMFGSIFSGVIVIMDRQFGFLKETLVAPISRLSIVLGKAFGGATTAVLQGVLIMLIALLLGAQIQFGNILLLLFFMLLISVMFVSLGIAIASMLEDMHGFQLISNFLIMPLFFLSGALFPLSSAPWPLSTASMLDPLTYGVNGLRFLLTGQSDIAFGTCLAVIGIFTAVFIGLAIFLFNRIED
ncbi:MAG: ABC transporter permease [Candidatus Diapherotrites archaeon]|nr:ABC transporter permease [Candidatus Diapherotrites archaeon]